MKIFAALFVLCLIGQPVFAEEGVVKETKEAAQDAGKNIKKAGRDVDNKICETINGKLKCVGKKIKNAAKNVGDEIKDKTH